MNTAAGRATTELVFLGRCLFTHEKFTRLEPLLVATSGGWRAFANRQETFPPAGKVFTVEGAALNCREQTPLLFRVAANTRPTIDQEHDRYIAVEVRSPLQVIDLVHLGSREAARRAVVEDGLTLDTPPTTQVVIIIDDVACVRIQLFQDPITNRWRPQDIVSLSNLVLWQFDRAAIAGQSIGKSQFFLPGREPSTVLERADWSPDSDFLKRVIRRLNKTAPIQAGGELYDFSRRAVDQLSAALRDREVLAGNFASDVAMRRRLADFLPALDAKLEAVEELVTELLRAPAIVSQIESEREEARKNCLSELKKELEPQVRAEIKSELGDAVTTVDQTWAEVADTADKLTKLLQEFQLLKSERDRQRAALSGEVGALLSVISDVAGAAERLGIKPAENGKETLPPWAVSFGHQSSAIEISELRATLLDKAQGLALPSERLLSFDALLRAGEIPLLFGSDAERLLRAYSACASGGVIWRTSIDAATISLDDLWRTPSNGSPTSFRLAWSVAVSEPDAAVLAVLDDIDASTLGRWLPRLTSFLSSDQRPSNFMVAGTLTPSPFLGRTASIDLLKHGLPFEIDASDGAVAAAILGRATEAPAESLRRLTAPFLPAVNLELFTQLSTILLRENVSFSAASRATGVFRAALATMSTEEAQAFAVEIAKLISSDVYPQTPTPNAVSFSHLAERTAGG